MNNLTIILQHAAELMPDFIRLVTTLSYVSGMYIVVINIAAMRNVVILGSPDQHQSTIWSLLKRIFVGAALIYFPSTVQVATGTLFLDSSPISYLSNTHQLKNLYDAVFNVALLVGSIAVSKGIYGLGYEQRKQDQPSTIIKSITHLIGGVFLINLSTFLDVIFTTIGIKIILDY